MNWKNITVGQYQRILPILNDEGTELDQLVKIICAITGKTESEVDSMPLGELVKYKFLFSLDFPKRIPKYIKTNGGRYRFETDIRKLKAGRYVESKAFLQNGFIDSLHLLLASSCTPMRRTMWGWETVEYDASKHEDYANDLKTASFPDAYNVCVFFCKVYRNWMQNILTSIPVEGLTKDDRIMLSRYLTEILDGSMQPLR